MRTRSFWLVPLVVALFVSGCGPGPADYSYPVAGGYQVWRSSGHQISVTPIGGGVEDPARMILPKVTKVAWNDRYVIAEQEELKPRNPNNLDCGGQPDNFDEKRYSAWSRDCYEEPNGVFHYWILDTSIKKTFGPYDLKTFDVQRQALGLSSLVLKDPRDYAPKETSK